MFKAAFSPFSGGGGGNNSYYNPNAIKFTGLGDMAQQIVEEKTRSRELTNNNTYSQGPKTGSFEGSASSVDMSTLPVFDGRQANVPMMPPANSAANTPVFSPATQEKAASVYGTDNERQGAVSGFKQEAKDKIMSELNNL
tara:strand:+ start:2885 stop:3304 length:420 start_codon:yes stop_codon:yes gene_type:complete